MKYFAPLVALLCISPVCQDSDDIDKLIHQLDSESIVEREKATRSLIQRGLPSKAKVEAASRSGNPERLARLKAVLEAINSQVEALPAAIQTILTEHAGSLHQMVRQVGKKVRQSCTDKDWAVVERALTANRLPMLEKRDARSGDDRYSEITYRVKEGAWKSEGGISFDLQLYFKVIAMIASNERTRHTVERSEARWTASIGRPLKDVQFPKGTMLHELMQHEELIKEAAEHPILKEIGLRYDLGRSGPWRHATSSVWRFEVLPELASRDGLHLSRPLFHADSGLDEIVWDNGAPGPSDWVSKDTLGPLTTQGGSKSDCSAGPWVLYQPSWKAPWAGPEPVKSRAYRVADLNSVPPESEFLIIEFPDLKESDLDSLAALPKLSRVWIDCKRITVGVLEQFARVKTLTGLDLSPDESLSVECVKFLSRMRLTYLHPSTGCHLDDANFEMLTRNRGLKSLVIGDSNSKLSDRGLEALGKLSDLESLEIWYSRETTKTGIAALAQLRKLRSLTIAYLRSFDDEALKLLSSSPGIEMLDLIELNITDEGLTQLKALKSLKYLRVSQCKRVTPGGMKALEAIHPGNLEYMREK